MTGLAGWKRERNWVRVRLAEARIQCRNKRSISDLEDRGQTGSKRGTAGSGKALERPAGPAPTSQGAPEQGAWGLRGQAGRTGGRKQ